MNISPAITITESVFELKTPLEKIAFPAMQPYEEKHLAVSDLHSIWYAQYGNPNGLPVLVSHGGPGFGIGPFDIRFCDPNFYRIIVFDQRGAKRSLPFAELKDNSTEHLIEDIEKLRKHLNIEKWLMFGGSWGSTLSMLYGQAYPERCLGFVLRGIFLATGPEIHQLWYGIRDVYPEVWGALQQPIPDAEKNDLVNAYHKRLLDPDPNIHMPAARSVIRYSASVSYLRYDSANIKKAMEDERAMLGVTRIVTHYASQKFFLENDQVMRNLTKIQHLPAIMVHGRYDLICRAEVAFDLHQAWRGSELVFVQDAGHSAMEPGIAKALIAATEKMKGLLVRNGL